MGTVLGGLGPIIKELHWKSPWLSAVQGMGLNRATQRWENGKPSSQGHNQEVVKAQGRAVKIKGTGRVKLQSWKLIECEYLWRKKNLKWLWGLGLGCWYGWWYNLKALEIKEKRLEAGEAKSSMLYMNLRCLWDNWGRCWMGYWMHKSEVQRRG